jgi:hypothetical protein
VGPPKLNRLKMIAVVTSIHQQFSSASFPKGIEEYNGIWGQGNCICDIRKYKLAEVVHMGDDDKFEVTENDVEIGDGDAYTTGKHYTDKEKWNITRFITMNKCINNGKGQ